MDFILLKNTRMKRGVTQEQISKAIGCNEIIYSLFEIGLKDPTTEYGMKIKEYLNLSDDEYQKIFR